MNLPEMTMAGEIYRKVHENPGIWVSKSGSFWREDKKLFMTPVTKVNFALVTPRNYWYVNYRLTGERPVSLLINRLMAKAWKEKPPGLKEYDTLPVIYRVNPTTLELALDLTNMAYCVVKNYYYNFVCGQVTIGEKVIEFKSNRHLGLILEENKISLNREQIRTLFRRKRTEHPTIKGFSLTYYDETKVE